MATRPPRGQRGAFERARDTRRPATPPARHARRPSRRIILRRRALVIAAGALLVALVTLALSGGGTAARPLRPGASSLPVHHTRARRPVPPAGAVAHLLSWHFPNAISREVVLPGRTQLVLTGGLVAGTSQSAAFLLDPATGRLTPHGQLVLPTHDAASFTLGGTAVVVGGGTALPASEVQTLDANGTARQSATLSSPRADATGIAVSGTGYVVGGYNGPATDAAVLATSNGTSFRTVAELPVPVRYCAVAALGGVIYVFGGTTLGGTPISTIQRIDLRTGAARVIGHLPGPLAGASAATLGGTIYLAGGQSAAGDSSTVSVFNPRTTSLRSVAHLPVATAYAGSTIWQGRLYVLGGENSAGAEMTVAQVITPTAR